MQNPTIHTKVADLLLEKSNFSEIANEVNKHIENKINEYCKSHNINFLDWSKNGKVKYWTNRTEYSYKEHFICGVEIIQDELIPDDFKLKKTLLLRYY